jgi:hypothetical protein
MAKKKAKGDAAPDVGGFVRSVLAHLLLGVLLGLMLCGSYGQFLCKLAHANVFPNDLTKYPYTDVPLVKPEDMIKNGAVPIHVLRGTGGKTFAQYASFSPDAMGEAVRNRSVMTSLREACQFPNQAGVFGNATLYYLRIVESMSAFSYAAISNVSLTIGSFCPEWMVMCIMGFGGVFLAGGLVLLNVATCIYYHLAHIPSLFRAAASSDAKAPWQPEKDISLFRPGKAFMACFNLLLSGPVLATLPVCTALSTLATPMYATYTTQDADKNSTGTASSFVRDECTYKATLIMIVSSLLMLSDINTYFGATAFLPALAVVPVAAALGFYGQTVNAKAAAFKLITSKKLNVKQNER